MDTEQRSRSERGEATTEMVLAVPVLMLLILTVIQFGLWYHASHVAESAAQEGARAARLHDATNEDGVNRARQFIDAAASSLISEVDVSRDTQRTDSPCRSSRQGPGDHPGHLASGVSGGRKPHRELPG